MSLSLRDLFTTINQETGKPVPPVAEDPHASESMLVFFSRAEAEAAGLWQGFEYEIPVCVVSLDQLQVP